MSKVDRKEDAQKAAAKPAPLGPDIDLREYADDAIEHPTIHDLGELPHEARERSVSVGMDPEGTGRSGSFFLIDHSVILSHAHHSGFELMSTDEALKKYDWLSDYWWKAVAFDTDKYTAQAELKYNRGYFVRALPGARVEFPLQACLFMAQNGLAQNVHNIIIAEEGSQLNIITGCATAPVVHRGLHIGVSEFYVKKNAQISFTMIHNWAEEMAVRPRSATIVEENGIFLSNFVCTKPVQSLQMYPSAYCIGKNATVRYNSVLFSHEGSHMDVGSRIFLSAEGSRAEVITRAVCSGGHIIARGHLIGEVPGIKAHLECRGLMLSEKGLIHAIPELEGKVNGVDMSHEAAVGKIAEEEIRYLMARGLSSEEATAAIVRGFMDIEIKGLPEHLKSEMKKAVTIGGEGRRL